MIILLFCHYFKICIAYYKEKVHRPVQGYINNLPWEPALTK